jgi:hypothetical protein
MTAGALPIRSPRLRLLRDRILRPTFPELWTFLAIALPTLAALVATLPTVDLAYQLRAGADILAGRGIPSVDAWTFTAAGRPWLDQQWGAQGALAAVYAAGGWVGLAVFRAALVGTIFALVLVAMRRRVPAIGRRTAAWLTLAAFVVAAPALALRPQLLGMLCFTAILAILAGRRERPGPLWLLPVIAAAWANLHGSFVLAPLLVALALVEDRHERSARAGRTLRIAVATGVATLLTPFGLDGWRYAAGLATNREVTARVTEWQRTTPTDVPGMLFWASVAFVALAVLVIATRRRRVPWPALLALVAFAALGAIAERGIAWWPLVAVVTVAGLAAPASGVPPAMASPSSPRRESPGSVINALVGAVLVVGGVAFLPAWRATDPGTGAPSGLLAHAPSGVTGALRDIATSSDRVWNPQLWGSWLEFAVPAPAYALDARIEVIPPEAWRDAEVVATAGPGWDAILDAAGVTIVVIDTEAGGWPLTQALASSGGWSLAHEDVDGAVWVRADR